MTRVLIVDDHPTLRSGLTTVLSQTGDIEVVGEAGTAEAALAEIGRLRPDVVILDHRLPGMSGTAACESLLETCPGARVIVVTQFASAELRIRAFRAGATGFVVKTTDPAVFEDAVRAVAAGERFAHPAEPRTDGGVLTDREADVLGCLAQGFSTLETAEALAISRRTVQGYINGAIQKLGVSHRSGAVAEAVRRGLA